MNLSFLETADFSQSADEEGRKTDRLTAKNNEKIKQSIAVRDSARARRESGMFFLEGARLCSDAAQSGIEIYRAFFSLSALKKYPEGCRAVSDRADEVYEISDEIAAKLSDTKNPQGIFCVCRARAEESGGDIAPDGKYLLLENVQDPSNLGAVVRTAEALGLDGLIICGGCDIYNPKALRASMGSALRLRVISRENAVDVIGEANAKGMLTLASTPRSDAVPVTGVDMSGGVVCVVGNEGNGVTRELTEACRTRVTIPMGGRAESLNAATAAAILIWEMVRK